MYGKLCIQYGKQDMINYLGSERNFIYLCKMHGSKEIISDVHNYFYDSAPIGTNVNYI